jgi:hypothetical protein
MAVELGLIFADSSDRDLPIINKVREMVAELPRNRELQTENSLSPTTCSYFTGRPRTRSARRPFFTESSPGTARTFHRSI